MSAQGPRKRGFSIYQDNHSDNVTSSSSRNKLRPLREKNCNISSLLSASKSMKSEVSKSHNPSKRANTPLLSAFPREIKLLPSRITEKEPNKNKVHLSTFLSDYAVVKHLKESNHLDPKERPYHVRHIPQILNTSANDPSSLVTALSVALSNLSTRLQVSKLDKQFNELIEVDQLSLLSPHEIKVRTKQSDDEDSMLLILHSMEPLRESNLARFLKSRLAVNSECYLKICNITWCLCWKFF